jgi:hypothetical protein
VNPAIPHSLAAIVAKCLSLAPEDRYFTAEALARDLDRFQHHQPLLVAQNPSRRERVTNWLTRHRRVLQVAASILVVTALAVAGSASGVFRSGGGNPRLEALVRPAVETLPKFQAAVDDVKQGEFKRAVGPLEGLVKEYPHASLVKLYLGLTYYGLTVDDEEKKREEAESYLRATLAYLDDENTLIVWAKEHPELASFLVDFAEATIQRVDTRAATYDSDNPADDEMRDTWIKRPSYQPARQALLLAEKLNPNCGEIQMDIQRLLAKTDEVMDDPASAHDRLSRLIQSNDSGIYENMTKLFFCRALRGRVTFLLVESLRDRGARLDETTLNMLAEADKDLAISARILEGNPAVASHRVKAAPESRSRGRAADDSNDHALKVYHVLHDRARLMLTLAEVEIDLNRPSARQHLQESRIRLDHLTKHVRTSGLKKPEPTRLTERFNDSSSRLNKAMGLTEGQDAKLSSSREG